MRSLNHFRIESSENQNTNCEIEVFLNSKKPTKQSKQCNERSLLLIKNNLQAVNKRQKRPTGNFHTNYVEI